MLRTRLSRYEPLLYRQLTSIVSGPPSASPKRARPTIVVPGQTYGAVVKARRVPVAASRPSSCTSAASAGAVFGATPISQGRYSLLSYEAPGLKTWMYPRPTCASSAAVTVSRICVGLTY